MALLSGYPFHHRITAIIAAFQAEDVGSIPTGGTRLYNIVVM